jgi:hypothetical protein
LLPKAHNLSLRELSASKLHQKLIWLMKFLFMPRQCRKHGSRPFLQKKQDTRAGVFHYLRGEAFAEATRKLNKPALSAKNKTAPGGRFFHSAVSSVSVWGDHASD